MPGTTVSWPFSSFYTLPEMRADWPSSRTSTVAVAPACAMVPAPRPTQVPLDGGGVHRAHRDVVDDVPAVAVGLRQRTHRRRRSR